MPTYCLRDRNGELTERHLSFAEFAAAKQSDGSLLVDGTSYEVDVAAQHCSPAFRKPGAKWPILSEAVSVNESDRHEAEAQARRCGVDLAYVPGGDGMARAEFKSNQHRRRCLKALGLIDKQAYS